MNFFEPSDFATEHGDLLAREAADMANHKLKCLLEAAPEVCAYLTGGPFPEPYAWFREAKFGKPTHKARLFMIERVGQSSSEASESSL